MPEGIQLVVLDMAGTTVHDGDLVLECFAAASQAAGLRATREELNARMGMDKRQVFTELAARQVGPGADANQLRDLAYDTFQRTMEGAYLKGGVQAIRGADDTFAWLHKRGIRIGLNTGFYRKVTEIILDGLRWRDVVDAWVCVDDVPEGRPAPYMIHELMRRTKVRSVHAVMNVGDTPVDMLAGHHAGCRAVVGVTSGAHPAGTLRRYPATHVVDGIWELPRLIARLGRLERAWPDRMPPL